MISLGTASACGNVVPPSAPPTPKPAPEAVESSARQSRHRWESYQTLAATYVKGYKKRKPRHATVHPPGLYDTLSPDVADSALDRAGPIAQLDPSKVPSISDSQLSTAFYLARDARFLESPGQPGFMRRESWLYPDDGCFARADLAAQQIETHSIPRPAKLFIFGNLEVQTPNAPSGSVTWWYHVVPAYRVGGTGPDSLRIIDPSIRSDGPMKLLDWASAQGADLAAATYSTCDSRTYEPGDSCATPDASVPSTAAQDEQPFLDLEWTRQVELGRDPKAVLGDSPPWGFN